MGVPQAASGAAAGIWATFKLGAILTSALACARAGPARPQGTLSSWCSGDSLELHVASSLQPSSHLKYEVIGFSSATDTAQSHEKPSSLASCIELGSFPVWPSSCQD